MIKPDLFADTLGLTGSGPKWTKYQVENTPFQGASWLCTDYIESRSAQSQRIHTLTIVGTCWQSNMFTGEIKEDTL